MALTVSAALRNAVMEGEDFKHAMSNCVLKVYSGAQPSQSEAAPTGTLLATYSDASGSLTREILSSGSVSLTGGASGSVDTLAVNSLEIMGSSTPFNTTLTQTAADVCTKINDNPKNHLFNASNSGSAVITIKAKAGMGTLPNAWTVVSTTTTITKTDANMAGGVTAVNGLKWGDSIGAVISKLTTQVWSGTAAATGTAGWFRFEASVSDAGGVDSTESIKRMDGTVATSGAELNMASTSIVVGTPQTVSSFAITFPTN